MRMSVFQLVQHASIAYFAHLCAFNLQSDIGNLRSFPKDAEQAGCTSVTNHRKEALIGDCLYQLDTFDACWSFDRISDSYQYLFFWYSISTSVMFLIRGSTQVRVTSRALRFVCRSDSCTKAWICRLILHDSCILCPSEFGTNHLGLDEVSQLLSWSNRAVDLAGSLTVMRTAAVCP